jgi:hypothetical protein
MEHNEDTPKRPVADVATHVAVLDYRVSALENRIEGELSALKSDLHELHTKVSNLPTYIDKKFQSQEDHEGKSRKNIYDRLFQVVTLIAVTASALAAWKSLGH